jgi:hypothetical protein
VAEAPAVAAPVAAQPAASAAVTGRPLLPKVPEGSAARRLPRPLQVPGHFLLAGAGVALEPERMR